MDRVKKLITLVTKPSESIYNDQPDRTKKVLELIEVIKHQPVKGGNVSEQKIIVID